MPIGDHAARFLSAVPLGNMLLISDYGGATLIKANCREATEAGGNHDIHPLALARRLAGEHGWQIIMTIGRHGMVCAERNVST